MSWSSNFPTNPGLYVLLRGSQFYVMRVLEGGLVKPANHKGKMAELFSHRTISGLWFGPIQEPEVEG